VVELGFTGKNHLVRFCASLFRIVFHCALDILSCLIQLSNNFAFTLLSLQNRPYLKTFGGCID